MNQNALLEDSWHRKGGEFEFWMVFLKVLNGIDCFTIQILNLGRNNVIE